MGTFLDAKLTTIFYVPHESSRIVDEVLNPHSMIPDYSSSTGATVWYNRDVSRSPSTRKGHAQKSPDR
jgi:hypothetical protein